MKGLKKGDKGRKGIKGSKGKYFLAFKAIITFTAFTTFLTLIAFITFLALLPNVPLHAELIKGARPLAMSGAFNTTAGDANSLFNNIAGIASIDRNMLELSCMPVYAIEDLYYFRAGYIFPYLSFKIGAGLNRTFLKDLFTQDEMVLGLGYALQADFLIGMKIKYLSFSVEKSPGEPDQVRSRLRFVTFDLGMMMKAARFLELSLSGCNLTDPAVTWLDGSLNVQSCRVFVTGIKVNFADYFSLTMDEEFRKSEKMVLKFGSELWFYDTVAVRAGIGRNEMYSLGAGLKIRYVNFDLGVQSHPVLGNQYQVDISFCY
ncbi:MAG: hypothetical protein PHF84_04825 [bacterium]|nr:hypothetical protein [bacterium]